MRPRSPFAGIRLGLAALAAVLAVLPGAPTPAQDVETVRQADRGVFRVVTNAGGSGTAFLVNEDGLLVTNAHVAEPGLKIYVLRQAEDGNDVYRADVLRTDRDADIAALRVQGLPGRPLTFAAGLAEKGQPVFALGFPGVADMVRAGNVEAFIDQLRRSRSFTTSSHSMGAVGRVIRESWQDGGNPLRIVQHSAAISEGSSGGPLMNRCGQVVGLNTAAIEAKGGSGAKEVFLASAAPEILRFLRRTQIAFTQAPQPCRTAAATTASGAGTAARNTGQTGEGQPTNTAASGSATLADAGEDRTRNTLALVLLGVLLTAVLALVAIRWRAMARKAVPGMAAHPADAPAPERQAGGAVIHRQTAVLVRRSAEPRGTTGQWRIKFHAASGKTGFRLTSAPGQQPSVIGRDRGAVDLPLDEAGISRRHAKLHRDDGGLVVEDLGSTNGTFVNGTPVMPGQPCRLRPGDLLGLGKLTGLVERD